MKTTCIILLMVGMSNLSFSNYSFINAAPEQVVKYELVQENTLVLPTDFAKEFIVNQEQLNKLSGNKIYHVELVYTQFKSSPSFDQVKLNEDRMDQVMRLIPQLKTDQPSWSLVEQTGAVTKEVANTYFHGFVIHYSNDLNYSGLNNYFEEFQQPFTQYEVDNKVGGQYKFSSGTTITIPPYAVVDANGNAIVGSYDLNYREFRNPAEIVFSGIPMTYKKNGEEYNFSSVGMYEITAQKDGQDLELQQPIVVDFNCTANKEDVSFYQMNNEGNWKVIEEINFGEASGNNVKSKLTNETDKVENANVEIVPTGANGVLWPIGDVRWQSGNLTINYVAGKATTTATLNDGAWRSYLNLKLINDTIFTKMVVIEDPENKEVEVKNESVKKFNALVMGFDVNWFGTANYVPEPGHTFPTVVKGLSSSGFGVYNCDQIYRIQKPINLSPTYVDKATGKTIEDKHVTCVIDLSYNGSFSFHPNHLTCNQEGKTVLLLFTGDKSIYMLSQQEFLALDKTNLRPELAMKNITDEVKNTDDLKRIMGI